MINWMVDIYSIREYGVEKLDKNEYNLKLEEIDKYVNQGNYSEAAKVADTIDWRRVRNVRTLCMISEIYEADNRYEDSKALLVRAYRRSPVGRAILYRLVEVTIHLKQFDEAIEYYSEYVQAAPHDNNKYILKYKIYRGRGSSVDEQIEILKEYLNQEYTEKWVYELAKLYQQAGKLQECLAACDDLVLWFHSGKYVTKALELKRKYAPLTPKQQEIYDHRFDAAEEEDDVYTDETVLGKEKQIVETNEDALAETIMADTEKEIALAVAKQQEEERRGQEGASEETAAEDDAEDASDEAAEKMVSGKEDNMDSLEVPLDEPVEDAQAFDDQLNKFNTQDLQTELVKSMREIVSGVKRRTEDDNEAADRVIEQSKQEQEAAMAAREQEMAAQNVNAARLAQDANAARLAQDVNAARPAQDINAAGEALRASLTKGMQMRFGDQMSGKAPQNAAGQLSIDDILLSMGEKGNAMREAAKAARARTQNSTQPAGVVSAVDEALMNMGVDLSQQQEAPKAFEAGRKTPEEFGVSQEAPENFETGREEEKNFETPESAQDFAAQEPEDIATAKTRRIPTDEIAEIHASYGIRREDLEEEETAQQAEPEYQEETQQERRDMRQEEVQSGRQEMRQEENFRGQQPDNRQMQPGSQSAYDSHSMLKDYQRELFNGFLEIQNMEAQIASAIALAEKKGDDRTSRSGNILIFGDHGCGKTTIATGIAKTVAQDRGNQFVKMAKIYATDLNRKDIAATIAKIAGGTLIIEEAGDLEDAIVDQLTTAMEFRTDGLIIILEDEQRYIHDLLMRHPRFTMKFTSQIFIPTFTIDELVRFGEIYAGNQDYVFSEAAATALYDRISSVSAQGDAVSITNVIELVDRAIHKSNKFFRKMSAGKKRYDENDCIILQEKDFR